LTTVSKGSRRRALATVRASVSRSNCIARTLTDATWAEMTTWSSCKSGESAGEVVTLKMFHREDEPLIRLFLSDPQVRQLDRLWVEQRFISRQPAAEYAYLPQFMGYTTQDTPKAFQQFFIDRKPRFQKLAEEFEQEESAAIPKQLDALLDFAARAYRRPLADRGKLELRQLYQALRDRGVAHDEAFRGVLAQILVAPAFLFRIEQAPPGTQPAPVNDWELATRLSYFLWSCGPDEELRRLAAAGRLRDPQVLAQQARRLLHDDRGRALAVEFGTQWIHVRGFDEFKSGAHLAPGGEVRSGISCDPVAANHLKDQTKVPSLLLGCEPSIAAVHKNYSMIYSSHISWSSPTTPVPLELYPALAFDRLFRDEVGRADKSVLDAVLEDARGLRTAVSKADQRRLDEYLSSVREVEQRIEQAGKAGRLQGWRPTLAKPDMPRPADGIPQDIGQHMRLMCDILVLAFRTDTTRIATLKLNNDHSSLRFPHLKVDYMIHHLLSHTESADWLKVNQFFTQQVAYIADKLEQVQEGNRTLLDNSMILYLSSMMTGGHNNDQLPVVLVGRGGGQIQTGRILDYLGKPNRKMCSLYLSLLDKLGVRLDHFGDSNERLAEI
jgi:hypothetical protein